jgi:hypothetical protein
MAASRTPGFAGADTTLSFYYAYIYICVSSYYAYWYLGASLTPGFAGADTLILLRIHVYIYVLKLRLLLPRGIAYARLCRRVH